MQFHRCIRWSRTLLARNVVKSHSSNLLVGRDNLKLSRFQAEAQQRSQNTFSRAGIFKRKEQNLDWAFSALIETSRSFAAVTIQLPDELKSPVCVFYVTLRTLDSIEDNCNLGIPEKRARIKQFCDTIAEPSGYCPDFKDLLDSLQQIPPPYCNIIRATCQQMGFGMLKFLDKPIETVQSWEEYCHFVAGIVGIGLSKMFVASGLESDVLISPKYESKSNSMGLLLQKTNIIRDCLEDFNEGRFLVPNEIWGKYVNHFPDLFDPKYKIEAVKYLNEIIGDALKHLPQCLSYLAAIQNMDIFRFCAIPQVMALATLARCYGNYNVLCENVKIPRKESSRIFAMVKDMATVHDMVYHYSKALHCWENDV